VREWNRCPRIWCKKKDPCLDGIGKVISNSPSFIGGGELNCSEIPGGRNVGAVKDVQMLF
jgi:hypothetical protein